MKLIKNSILKLQKLLCYHDYLYYSLDQPIISDYEYDLLVKRLRFLKKKYHIVNVVKFPKNNMKLISYHQFKLKNHVFPMLSLQHTCHRSGFIKFYKSIKKFFTKNIKIDFFCELKFDGLALSLLYREGELIRALTRGNGLIGENVTNNAYMIHNIPKKLHFSSLPKTFEVRGEVCMLKKDLDILNAKAMKNNQKIFSNTRNAAAGTLRQNNPEIVQKRNLIFYSYSLNILEGKNSFINHSQQLFFLHSLGFKISPYILLSSQWKKILNFYYFFSKIRSFLSFNIDGIVIKINSIELQKKIGNSTKFPKWSIALKFLSQYAQTKLLRVTYKVGRTGVITPVADVIPTVLSGVIIKKISLHNKNLIEKLNLYIGDSVIICRSGDVIPKIVSVIYSNRLKKFQKVFFPLYCPSCLSFLSIQNNKKNIQCLAGMNCFEQKKKMIYHFFSKDAVYVKGFGISVIKKIIHYGYINTPLDCFKLNINILLKIKSFGKKKSNNIISGLEKCKKTSLKRFIYGLSIPNIGIENSGLLADFFGCLDNMINCTMNELLQIKKLGRKNANIFFNFMNDGKNIQYIKKFIKEVKLFFFHEKKNISCNQKTFLTKKKIVLSGQFQNYSRMEMINKILNVGGIVLKSISKKTDFLIIGKNPGKKLLQASDLNIKILKEIEIKEIIL